MPQFSYKAKTGPEQVKDGVIQAENKLVVIRKLRQEGLFPISIEEINPIPSKSGYRKISSSEISAFTRQLANLIHSGFSLASALSTLSQQEQNPSIKKLIEDLHEKIQKGSTFSAALSAYPKVFSSFYINMVKIGEAGGRVDDALSRLADFKEREEELISQIRAALIYPLFVLSLGIITVFVIVTFFIPRFVSMFSDLGQALPLPTQILLGVSEFMSKFWGVIILGLGVIIALSAAYYKKENNRLVVDGFILRLPLVKTIVQKLEISRFTYALGILLKYGVPVLEALAVVSFSVDNRVFRKKIASFQEKIKKGQSLSSCLQADPLFPPVLRNMVTVGEESGELNEMLLKIAGTFESEVNRTVKTMVSMIEPGLILFIGGIVVLLVLSILLPIFRIDLLVK